jgi:hypothetical protein
MVGGNNGFKLECFKPSHAFTNLSQLVSRLQFAVTVAPTEHTAANRQIGFQVYALPTVPAVPAKTAAIAPRITLVVL